MGYREWLAESRQRQKAALQFSSPEWSISDPSLAALFASWVGISSTGLPSVSETDALGITAFGRGVELIAGTLAGLPLDAYRKHDDGTREKVPSVLDRPQGPYGITPFQWREMVYLQLVIYREAFLLHIVNGAGVLDGFWPIHPYAVNRVAWVGPRKHFWVRDANGVETEYDDTQVTHVMGPNAYGLRGVPLYIQYRKVFQTAIAGEIAAGRSFAAPMLSGLISTAPDEDIDDEEAKILTESLNARLGGAEKAGQFAFVNRHLELKPWTMTNVDAQFMESRQYQNEEFARILGLPPHLLALIDKQTSWGTGVSEQNIGLARYTLQSYSQRLESALDEPLGELYAETDYKGLLQGSPADEINLLLAEVGGPILDVDEARAKLNLGPMPKQPTPPAPAVPVGVTANG